MFHYEWWKRAASPSASEIATFVEIFRSVQASAVHVNTIVIRGPMIAARLEGVPVVCHAREIIPHDEPLLRMIGLPAEIVQETISETADWIVANSKATASAFTKAGRTVVIPNTVDPALFDIPNRICSNAIKFGMISSNLPKKGIEDFVALAKEARGVKNAKFLIIGENTKLIERLKEEQSRNQIPSNIEFVGYQENPVNAISMVNVVVNFSSFAESFGRTVLEGLAARRPAIVYEWGALPELVHDGLNGYVVPYRRYLSAVNRVQELCRDPELIGRLGENGRAMAIRSFGKVDYSSALCGLYRNILGRAVQSSVAATRQDAQLRLPRSAMPSGEKEGAKSIDDGLVLTGKARGSSGDWGQPQVLCTKLLQAKPPEHSP